jgi:hypothetical protein
MYRLPADRDRDYKLNEDSENLAQNLCNAIGYAESDFSRPARNLQQTMYTVSAGGRQRVSDHQFHMRISVSELEGIGWCPILAQQY